MDDIILLFGFPALLWAVATVYVLTGAAFRLLPKTSTCKVGGLRFIKIGRFCFSYCITKTYKPFN